MPANLLQTHVGRRSDGTAGTGTAVVLALAPSEAQLRQDAACRPEARGPNRPAIALPLRTLSLLNAGLRKIPGFRREAAHPPDLSLIYQEYQVASRPPPRHLERDGRL
jgi:hypothetical protein